MVGEMTEQEFIKKRFILHERRFLNRDNRKQKTEIAVGRNGRIKLLFRGKIWVSLMTFNNDLQPSSFTVDKWDMLNKPGKTKSVNLKKNIPDVKINEDN